ncbi:MAG: phage major capsid protein, partial [Deltaproteobacteria bacterium]|nr:phage major capsid protein [Deltaproteobacteria bacterium]
MTRSTSTSSAFRKEVAAHRESQDKLIDQLEQLTKPDRSTVPNIHRSGDRASLHAVEGAEREWADNATRLLSEEERTLRSYAQDRTFARWFQAFARGDMEEARRADPEWARTLTTAAGGDGLVAPGYFASLVFLKERSASRLGSMMTQISTTDASVRVPYEATTPTALTVAEGGDMTSGQTEPDVEALSVTPIKLGQVVSLTRELIDDSPLSVTGALAGRVAHAIGEKEDDLFLNSADGGAVDFGDAGGLIAGGTASSDTWDDDAETLATVVSKLYEMP